MTSSCLGENLRHTFPWLGGFLTCRKQLGAGTYGTVFEAGFEVGTAVVAVKVHSPDSDVQDLAAEHAFLDRLRHPFILATFGFCASSTVALVLELGWGHLGSFLAERVPITPDGLLLRWQICHNLIIWLGRGKKRGYTNLLGKAARHLWLPAQLPQLSEKELKEVDNLPEKADLTRVHAQILFHKAALSTGAARAVLCTDLSASNFSRHQVFVGELPPLKPRSEVLTLCAKGKLRHLTCSEVLAAKGYRLGEVNLHLLHFRRHTRRQRLSAFQTAHNCDLAMLLWWTPKPTSLFVYGPWRPPLKVDARDLLKHLSGSI